MKNIKSGDLIKAKLKWGSSFIDGIGFVYGEEADTVGLSLSDGGCGNYKLDILEDVIKIEIVQNPEGIKIRTILINNHES